MEKRERKGVSAYNPVVRRGQKIGEKRAKRLSYKKRGYGKKDG